MLGLPGLGAGAAGAGGAGGARGAGEWTTAHDERTHRRVSWICLPTAGKDLIDVREQSEFFITVMKFRSIRM